jgi:hypothetical protein
VTPDERAAIEARHYPTVHGDPSDDGDTVCAGDEWPWPCDTERMRAALLSLLDVARAAARDGLALERLPSGCVLGRFDDGTWAVFADEMARITGSGATPTDAIAAALGGHDD